MNLPHLDKWILNYNTSDMTTDISDTYRKSGDCRPTRSQTCDVLVVGGGATGLAAAVTAAEQGLRVILLERYGFCGGGAVAGLSGTICGLYQATKQPGATPSRLVHGFAARFVQDLDQRGGLGPAIRYGHTWTHVHDPLMWRETADALIAKAGVQVLYHALVVGVLNEGGERIEGVVASTKEGPLVIRAAVTIDASGDADVVAMAGWSTVMGANGKVQNPTMIFRLLGVDVARFLATYGHDTIMPTVVTTLIQEAQASGAYHLPRQKIWLFPTTRPGELLCNCTRVLGGDGRELNGAIAQDLSEAEVEGRRQVREYARFFRNRLAGCEQSFVNDTGVQVGIRQTRQGVGVSVLRNTDVVEGRKCADGVARSPWPIELHSGDKPKVHWLLDDWYEVPYCCFVPVRGEGLLFAGRCLSAEHEAVASARVTAQCFAYGHAVGHAAAISLRERLPLRHIDGVDLRSVLNRHGAELA
jgi:ribulose 1,5-bisphosphate synthetase/thiazole synthase